MKVPQLLSNLLASRVQWLTRLLDPRRNIDQECGHPEVLTVQDYRKVWRRGDIGRRIVSLYPQATWTQSPSVYETEDEQETAFETEWNQLLSRIPIFAYLSRADELSGIGRFGVVLIGLDDGKPLSEPVEGVAASGDWAESSPVPRKLLYLRPLDESMVEVQSFESDTANPRYGLPTYYNLSFGDASGGSLQQGVTIRNERVHWTRILHIADNRDNSEVFGMPRLEVVFDRVLDLHKVAGGSGEMFWKGGFPGLSLETQPDLQDVVFDKEATKEEMEAYMNGLQRYIATIGMSVKSLSVQVADPLPHMELQLRLIAAAMAVPWRMLLGSEEAKLASVEDSASWAKQVGKRRVDYVNPFILHPFIGRLIAVGVLPMPDTESGFLIDWPDLNTPSDAQKAEVAERKTNALSKYVAGGVDTLIPPFHYLTLVLDMSPDEAEAVIKEAMAQEELLTDRHTQEEPDADADVEPATRN